MSNEEIGDPEVKEAMNDASLWMLLEVTLRSIPNSE